MYNLITLVTCLTPVVILSTLLAYAIFHLSVIFHNLNTLLFKQEGKTVLCYQTKVGIKFILFYVKKLISLAIMFVIRLLR